MRLSPFWAGVASIGEGWYSMFSWMLPTPKMRTYKEMSDDLDEQMQELYDRYGWGEYKNPLHSWEEWRIPVKPKKKKKSRLYTSRKYNRK